MCLNIPESLKRFEKEKKDGSENVDQVFPIDHSLEEGNDRFHSNFIALVETYTITLGSKVFKFRSVHHTKAIPRTPYRIPIVQLQLAPQRKSSSTKTMTRKERHPASFPPLEPPVLFV